MTVILGLLTEDVAVIGADGRATDGRDSIVTESAAKITRAGPWAIGCCGEARTSKVLAASRDALGDAEDIWALTVAIKRTLEADGYVSGLPKDDTYGSRMYGGPLIVAGGPQRPSAWFVGVNLDPTELQPGRPHAVGSGGGYAIGAAAALLSTGSPLIATIVYKAIEIACRYQMDCGGKIIVESYLRERVAAGTPCAAPAEPLRRVVGRPETPAPKRHRLFSPTDGTTHEQGHFQEATRGTRSRECASRQMAQATAPVSLHAAYR
jgi:hypothetical protein